MDYILIVLTENPKEYTLENPDMSLMLDIIRDSKHIMNISRHISSGKYIGCARVNIVRESGLEMNIMCALFRQCLGYNIKYQPERLKTILKIKQRGKVKV